MGICCGNNNNKEKNENQSPIGNKILIKNVNQPQKENKIQNQSQIEIKNPNQTQIENKITNQFQIENKIPNQNKMEIKTPSQSILENKIPNQSILENKIQNQSQIENKIPNQNELRKSELYTFHKPVPLDIANEVLKSICKITIKFKNGDNICGTGFFMNMNNSMKYLITNNHIINKDIINEDIEIEIYNNKKMKLDINNRDLKYYPYPKDITIIEIKNNDEIYEYIKVLYYDTNYKIKGYEIYNNIDIFSIGHPLGNGPSCASGTITYINNFEFEHNIPTDDGSSGCPIILLNNNKNLIQVIGIHKEAIISKKVNRGTFIGEIFNDIIIKEKDYNDNDTNYITSEIDIKDDDINKEIRIINSYEEDCRINEKKEIKKEEKNEEEIKKCKISINNQIIKFNYYHKFQQKGKHIIKYSFNDYLTKTNYLFLGCESLISINLSNFNTQNVVNMFGMFYNCKSLKIIDLSNFNTQNVTYMSGMFFGCESLTNINLSNFDTQNVTNMSHMFNGCESLTNIDLSNFNTKNVTDMSFMLLNCKSLKNIDLSNFDTKNVTNMSHMFSGCKSLKNIDLSNFNTEHVVNMSDMFLGCESLDRKNIITKDKKIKSKFHI